MFWFLISQKSVIRYYFYSIITSFNKSKLYSHFIECSDLLLIMNYININIIEHTINGIAPMFASEMRWISYLQNPNHRHGVSYRSLPSANAYKCIYYYYYHGNIMLTYTNTALNRTRWCIPPAAAVCTGTCTNAYRHNVQYNNI